MRVLALEPYYGGSHQAFLDGWIDRSRHRWTLFTLEPFKWKWRMRHGAIEFAGRLAESAGAWDVVWCSDMLNLAEFVGLAPPPVRELPRVAYFHENQITYPVRHATARDYQFGLTNLTTALAADAVWFNSAFHRDAFLEALPGFLELMPDHRPLAAVEEVRAKAEVHSPGVAWPLGRERATSSAQAGPLTVTWAARWEFDKDPETLFEAVRRALAAGTDLRLNVLGESFTRVPPVFAAARDELDSRIDAWGYQPRADYERVLAETDVFVSTARHEFFGLSVLEAIAAGAWPLLPRRLSYPELLGAEAGDSSPVDKFFYRGGAAALAERLVELGRAKSPESETRLELAHTDEARRRTARFAWRKRAAALDRELERVALRRTGAGSE